MATYHRKSTSRRSTQVTWETTWAETKAGPRKKLLLFYRKNNDFLNPQYKDSILGMINS
jgi:hypothetical protein